MASDSSVRSTLVGAALAGVVSVLVLSVLTAAAVGSELVRVVAAVALGVGIAQLYERKIA